MMFSKYEIITETASIYCYKDTNVLINKFKIKDFSLLKQAEEELTAIKQYEMLIHPIKGNLTKTHLFHIHHFLFEDI